MTETEFSMLDFRMQLHHVLVVTVVSDVKVMSSTVAVINCSAITRVANNYNIRSEPRFFNKTEPNSF